METIKTYGLKFYDLPTMISNVNYFLKRLAVNIDPRNKENTGLLCWLWLVFTLGCYFYVYVVSMAWFVFVRCRETGDVFAAAIVFSLGVSSEISTTKLLYTLCTRNKLRKIVAQYLELDSQVVPGTRFAVNLQPTLRSAKKRALIVWNVIIWNGIIYTIKPLLKPGREMPEDIFEFYGVKDMKSHPEYDIIFVVNAIASVFITCYPAACITAFFIIITGYSEAQIIALSEELTYIWSDAVTQYNKLSSLNAGNLHVHAIDQELFVNEYTNKQLIEAVKKHAININLLKRVEGVFRGATAIGFMLLVVGLTAELLGGLEKTYIQVPFTMMFVTIECVTGQRIIDASRVFEDAVYNSRWENFDVRNRKIVLLMLQNSQKTMALSVAGLVPLSFDTLMQVIRMTYSAYTTLRSTM